LSDTDDHQQQAWIIHQEAKLLLENGDLEEASKAVAQAVKLYRKLGDRDGEARASIIKLQILETREGTEAAIKCARKVIRTAKEHGHDLPLASGYLAYGRLLSKSGSPEKGILELRKALAHAVLLDNKFVEFHAHYNLWKAHEQQGDRDRMRFEFQSLSHFLKFIDASSKEAREVKAMLEQEENASRRGRRKRRRPTA
jgi:tetratricopeptide (TPR) repeat protein